MKSNIVRGGGGRTVELRGEIGLKCSKMAKCLNTFVAHCCFLVVTQSLSFTPSFPTVKQKCIVPRISHREVVGDA